MTDEDLTVLYDDNQIIVVLKPQNVPCCPDESGDDSLYECVKRYIKTTYNKPGNVYLGLCHRLDRPTGGVMVFAKTDKAASRLCAAIKDKGFEKKYLAVLCGSPSKQEGRLENYLRKSVVNNMVYVCTQTEEGAKFAALEYKILEQSGALCLADITLETGRSHQIRVQMSSVGCPVYGDMRYGGYSAVKGNLALWAYYLSFEHPVTKDIMKFYAEPPKENKPWSMFRTNIDQIAKNL